MPSPSNHHLPEASSSTAAEKAISSLRARLRSEDMVPCQESAHATNDQQNHVHAKLEARFSKIFEAQADQLDSSTNTTSANLSATFALYGQEIYNTSLKAVESAYETTSASISNFHTQAASASTHTRHLYDNISYPLSATLCHSRSFPSASIGRHVRALNKKLSAAETELSRLNEEWKRCTEEEAMILAERVVGADAGAKKKMDGLVESIEDIVRTRGDEIDELDQVC
ncbi:hypothetical protein EsDP_00007281 [Epichloe bromicola]|uniref:Uncharacterized protein n=1 Tax=Epichloe bromicola TaxID=79588 RepID=A0ABQ0D059_9HYPO